MFSGISWSNYIITLVWILSGYYLGVILLFYRGEMGRIGKSFFAFADRKIIKKSKEENLNPRQEDMYQSLQELADGLRQSMHIALRKGYTKEELLVDLKEQIQQKKELQSSNYKAAINNLIQTEAENINSIPLSEQEVESMWRE